MIRTSNRKEDNKHNQIQQAPHRNLTCTYMYTFTDNEFANNLIATVGHLLPWNSYTWAEYHVHWTYMYRAEPAHDRSHVALIAQLVEHCTGNAKVVGSNPVQSLKFLPVIFPVVLWLHSHLSFFHYLIATVGHLLPWNSYTWAEYHVHWTYRAKPTQDRSHVALIAQLVEHCRSNAKVMGSNPVQTLKFFQVIFPVVLWLHSHLSFFHFNKVNNVS